MGPLGCEYYDCEFVRPKSLVSDCFVRPKSLVSDCFDKCVEMFKKQLFCMFYFVDVFIISVGKFIPRLIELTSF